MRWVGAIALLMVACSVSAHRFAPSLLEVQQRSATQFAVTWKTPIAAVTATPMRPLLPEGCEITGRSPWITEGTGRRRQIVWQCRDGLVGKTLGISGIAENMGSALLTLHLDAGIAHQQVLNADAPSYTVPKEPDQGEVVTQYTVLGAEHIWLGIDHLLFVLGLLLLVGRGRRLIWTVTAFTVGHSLTLAMVTLGWFTYPVALIEFLISLSIFVLAVELTRERGISRLWRQPWWLAGLFGLLHGMGFAGALAETGLPQSNLPLALLFFNLGIELGQLAFIAVLLILGAAVQKLLPNRTAALAPIPVVILGVLSAMWCIERGIGVIS